MKTMVDTVTSIKTRSQSWLWLNITALGFALAHVFIDFHIGLFGETANHMSLLQAGNILILVLINAWWVACLAAAVHADEKLHSRWTGLSGAFSIAFIWAFLGNGLVAVVAAPPPSAAFPYQDVTHFGSLVFGGLAAYSTWKEMKTRSQGFKIKPILAVGLLLVLAIAVNGILALTILQS
jgi:hypothetical protein